MDDDQGKDNGQLFTFFWMLDHQWSNFWKKNIFQLKMFQDNFRYLFFWKPSITKEFFSGFVISLVRKENFVQFKPDLETLFPDITPFIYSVINIALQTLACLLSITEACLARSQQSTITLSWHNYATWNRKKYINQTMINTMLI